METDNRDEKTCEAFVDWPFLQPREEMTNLGTPAVSELLVIAIKN